MTSDRCARCDCAEEIAALKREHESFVGRANAAAKMAHQQIEAASVRCEELMAMAIAAERERDLAINSALKAEADAAAMWTALEEADRFIRRMDTTPCASGRQEFYSRVESALSSRAGAALLERLAKAEEDGSMWESRYNVCHRKRSRLRELQSKTLAACQSLHRKWRGAYRTARDYGEAMENVCDALGMKETHWMVIGSDVAEVVAERDALRAEVERLKEDNVRACNYAAERVAALEGAQRRSAFATRNLCEYVSALLFSLAEQDKPHQDHFKAQVEAWMPSALKSFDGVPEETECALLSAQPSGESEEGE